MAKKSKSRFKYFESLAYILELAKINPIRDTISFNVPVYALYGKVDQNQNFIFISETNLKGFASAPDVLAADFVVDACENFQKEIDQAIHKGIIGRKSFLRRIKFTKGWISTENLYHEHMKQIYAAFIGIYLNKEQRHAEIKNFNDFVESFLNFCRIYSKIFPITLTKFISSAQCPVRVSGLIVEMMDKPYNDKKNKFKMVRDPDFQFYKEMANKHGLKVDHDVPWRLIADIRNAKTRYYMNRPASQPSELRYGISDIEMLFKIYYYKTYRYDVIKLKKYLVSFYNSFVENLPFSKKPYTSTQGPPYTVKHCFIRRKKVEESQIDSKFSNAFWSLLYFKIRMIEQRIKISDSEKDKILKKIDYYNKRISFDKAAGYVNDTIFKLQSQKNI